MEKGLLNLCRDKLTECVVRSLVFHVFKSFFSVFSIIVIGSHDLLDVVLA